MTEDRLLYLDDCFACVNKLPSELVEWNESGDTPLAEDLRRHLGGTADSFVGIVHRLDRPTSGVVMFARSGNCLRRLNEMLREGSIEKTYWAVVDTPPPEKQARLDHYILHQHELNKSYAFAGPRSGARLASLVYRHISSSDRYHLLEIDLLTGRHHQIRAQLHRIGCHIKGDLKYGFPRSNKGGGIHLHARRVGFAHPLTGNRIVVTAPVPDEPLWRFFEDAIESRR
ncbi:MAG: RluA family pseudouridine synthase [Spirochaetaceae bacterium]